MKPDGLNLAISGDICAVEGGIMTHPGLPLVWAQAVWVLMALFAVGAVLTFSPKPAATRHLSLVKVPVLGALIQKTASSALLLGALKLVFIAVFLVIIAAGLFGSPIPERNAATVLTWNLWWSGLILAVFFLGSAWCAVCPWDSLANLMVRRTLFGRAKNHSSLELRVPKYLRNIWPALVMLVGLTWLELGVGVTFSPYTTAVLALAIVVLATVSMATFERKAFCQFFCPVGRTVGFYSQLSPVELRPQDPQICASCTSLECYHGSQTVAPCPTHQVMGRMTQNTYCTSCSNCVRSCPHDNVIWRLRSPSAEAIQDARPHWDEAWFMLGLLALTGFHGLTMLTFWGDWISALARVIGDSGQLLLSFTIGFALSFAAPVLFYATAVWLTRYLGCRDQKYKAVFSRLAFVALPLAFAYHLAHNLNHLMREGSGLAAVLTNPLGLDAGPLGSMEKHLRAMQMVISQESIFALQAGLLALGFLIAMLVIIRRGHGLMGEQTQARKLVGPLSPMVLFAVGMTLFHVWMLMQPMTMRM